MKVVVFLPLLAVVYCAPVNEPQQAAAEVSQDDIRVKRAKEVMMFGNQQNENKNKEKRTEIDPGTTGPMDKDGLILAKEPVDLESSLSSQSEVPLESGSEESDEQSHEGTVPEEAVPLTVDDNTVQDSEETMPLTVDNKLEDPLESEEVDEADSSELGDAADTVEEGESNEDSVEQQPEDFENPSYWSKYVDLLKEADSNAPSQYNKKWWTPYNTYSPFSNYGYRRRRSQVRNLRGQQMPRARVLKRSRRIKRDLVYPADVVAPEYLPYEDEYPYPYGESADDEELLNLLYDKLQDNYGGRYLAEEEPYVYAPYDILPLEDVEEEPNYYLANKRQAGLNFMPGMKRSRDFYPYYEEPDTHFSAFVPTKRSLDEYADAYQRVMELAAALRRQNYYPEEEYGPYESYDFRRRK